MLSGIEIEKRMNPSKWSQIMFFITRNPRHNIRDIFINPFDSRCVGPNSYDVHLDKKLLVYTREILDPKGENPTREIIIPHDGFVLQPDGFYLGSTIEYTETFNLVPKIDGRSSVGRLGINIHATAGFGDVGFCGRWTLEITVAKPVIVYPKMRIGQLYYEHISKKHKNYVGHYSGQRGAVASKMNHRDNWERG